MIPDPINPFETLTQKICDHPYTRVKYTEVINRNGKHLRSWYHCVDCDVITGLG